jgi:hypothetical protein
MAEQPKRPNNPKGREFMSDIAQVIEAALDPYIGTPIVVFLHEKRNKTGQLSGTLLSVTETGYTVQGPHYREWFFHQDLYLGINQIAGECAEAVDHAIHRAALLPPTAVAYSRRHG